MCAPTGTHPREAPARRRCAAASLCSAVIAVLAVPSFVAIATLLARRFGHGFAGLVAGLPLTSGPLSVAFALGRSPGYAAHAAIGSNVGILAATLVYALYGLAAPAVGWRVAAVCSPVVFCATALVLVRLQWTVPSATVAAILSAAVACVLLGRNAPAVAPLVNLELLPRVLAALAVVAGLSALMRIAGPLLIGALTPMPVVVGILVVFAQRRLGSDAALLVLRGAARGTYAFASFFGVVGLFVERLPLLAVYALATAAAVLTIAPILPAARDPRGSATATRG